MGSCRRKILTLDERLVVIPNNTLISSSITNFARGGGDGMARRLYLTLDVGVDYDEDPAHVKGVLLEVLEKSPFVLDDPSTSSPLVGARRLIRHIQIVRVPR